MRKRPTPNGTVFSAIERTGLVARGAFRLAEAERAGALAGVQTIVLIGMAGRDGWGAFAASPEAHDGLDDPLDRFSRRVIGALADDLGALALFPFGEPPYWPFQQWARRAEPVHPSPIGLLIHPRYGLWHSYRGALGFASALEIPTHETSPSPCDSCAERPCLSACPVCAFSARGYDVAACAAHLRRSAVRIARGRGAWLGGRVRSGRNTPTGGSRRTSPCEHFCARRTPAEDHGQNSISWTRFVPP